MHTFVIAEAGISHDGDITRALKLIDHAKAAGADACKFQTFNAKRICQRRGRPELDLILKPYEMPLTWLPQLKKHCDEVGIEFMTTCFDEETIPIVAPFVNRFKIGHGESADLEFYMAHVRHGKPIIASVADPDLDGWSDQSVETNYLWCRSKYPCPPEDADLAGIAREECHGYSDHTKTVAMGSWAVAAGAKIVEVHFHEWETDKDNLDRPVSLDPSSLIRYVTFVRQAELAVYGAAEEGSTTPGPQQSAPHTSRPQASGEDGPSAYHPAVEP